MAEQAETGDKVAGDIAPALTQLAVAPPAPEAKVRMLGPNNIVYNVDGAQAKLYEAHGYSRYEGPTIDEGSIEAKFGAWRKSLDGAPTAAGLGALNQVPFLDYGLSKVAPDSAKDLAEATAQAREQHPYAYGAGSIGGALGTFAAGGAAVKGAAGALGLASRLPTLAAAAKASPILASMAEGAAGNAAFNVADQVDAAALDHALSPEGQEKVSFSVGQTLGAALIGGAVPGVLAAAPAAIGRSARKLGDWSRGQLVDAFVDPAEQQALREAGKGDVIERVLWPLIEKGEGSDETLRSLTNRAKDLATTQNELLVSTRDTPMKLEEARQTLANARAQVSNSRLVEDDLRPLSGPVDSHDAHAAAHSSLQIAQANLARAQAGGNARTVRRAESAVRAVSKQAEATGAARQPLPKDIDLQQMAEKLYSRVNFRDPVGNPNYEQYMRAGREVAKGRDMLFDRVRPDQATPFRENRAHLSDTLAVLESIGKKHIPNVMSALSKAGNSAALAGTMSLLGVRNGAGVISSAATGGGMALLYYGSMRHLAAASRGLTNRLVKADAHLAGVIKAGLLGTSLPRAALHEIDYQDQAARVLAAQRDPATAYSNIHQGLLKQGIPEPVADKVAPRVFGMAGASAMSLPKPANTPDIATAAQPDLHQQRAWLSQHRSRMDPTYALSYPTPQNMQAAKQHHPETIMRAQEAVTDALAKNPYLPIASRMWAARVLGRPAGGLTSPKFYQSLAQMRAKDEAEAQQGSQGPQPRQRGNAGPAAVQSEQSRLDELSNRQ